MDITPTRLGADVDITEESMQLIDLIAEAFADRETYIGQLLVELAGANRNLRSLQQDQDVAEWKTESASAEADGIREALQNALDLEGGVRFPLLEGAAARAGRELLAAADQSMSAVWRRERFGEQPRLFIPGQPGGRAA